MSGCHLLFMITDFDWCQNLGMIMFWRKTKVIFVISHRHLFFFSFCFSFRVLGSFRFLAWFSSSYMILRAIFTDLSLSSAWGPQGASRGRQTWTPGRRWGRPCYCPPPPTSCPRSSPRRGGFKARPSRSPFDHYRAYHLVRPVHNDPAVN